MIPAYTPDVWTIHGGQLLEGCSYFIMSELGIFGLIYYELNLIVEEDQFILKITPLEDSLDKIYFSGVRVWFNRDPHINSNKPFALILKPELGIDFYNDSIPLCNFCLCI